jgi:general secretion pathway protein F
VNTFQYTGFDAAGTRARGLVEALDPRDARERLARRGILVATLVPASARAARAPAFDDGVRSLVYRELSALLQAGLPMDKSLELVVQTPELAASAGLLAGVRDRVRAGGALHAALAAADPRVTPFETALLQVGESTGNLPDALAAVAEALEEERKIRDHVRTALTYPALVLALAATVLVVLAVFLLPTFAKMMQDLQTEPPLLTRLVMGLGQTLRWLGLPLVLAGIALGGLGRKRLAADPGLRRAWDRRRCRLPLLGRPYVNLLNLRFARTWAHLVRAGVGITESFPLAARATGNAWVEDLAREQLESIRAGGAAADALARIPPLAESLPGWVRAGEATADLPGLLGHAAARYEQAWRREVARKLAVLEPLVLLAVAALVLLIAVAVLLPMLQLNRAFGA